MAGNNAIGRMLVMLWLGIGLGVAGTFSYFQNHEKQEPQTGDKCEFKIVKVPVYVQVHCPVRPVIIEKPAPACNPEYEVREGESELIPVWPDTPKSPSKNRFLVYGGIGYDQFQDLNLPDGTPKNRDRGIVGGLGYERELSERISVGVFGFSNATYGINVGYRF